MEKDDLMNINSKRNLKKPIIYGAAAFLVFIIGVIGYAIYANSATNKDNVVLPPQVNEKPIKSDFTELKVEDNLTDINQKINKNEIITNTEKNSANLNTQKEVKPKEVQSNTAKPQEAKKVIETQKTKPKEIKPLKTTKIEHKKTKTVSKGKYYIQVAALLKYKKPNKRFLALIKKEGFDYKLYHTVVVKNNQKIPITKILVGPFANRKIAMKNLVFIKKKLTQNAFIFRMK